MMKDEPTGIQRPTQTHTTTTHTTTTTSPAYNLDWIKVDVNHFKTLPGIIKLVQFFLGIFCMAIGAPARVSGTHFFRFVAVMAFIFTSLWICIYFFSIREGLSLRIPWVVMEFYYTAGTTFFYAVAMIVQFACVAPYNLPSGTAAAVFGLFNTVAYGFGAYLLFKDWKQVSPAAAEQQWATTNNANPQNMA